MRSFEITSAGLIGGSAIWYAVDAMAHSGPEVQLFFFAVAGVACAAAIRLAVGDRQGG